MENSDNLLGVIATLYKWRKQILKVTLISAIGAALIALLFLKNYYKSTTVFYVASPDLFKPEQVFGTSNKDMDYYGDDSDIDRVLTIAQSRDLYEYLIKKFNLYKHYDIDSTKEKAPFKVQEELMELYTAKKTKLDAIELSVEDTDKQLAADMVNAARIKIDELAQLQIRETQLRLIKAYESNFVEKEKSLVQVGDTLARIRQNYGVIDPEKQTEAITKVAVEAQANYFRSKAKLDVLKGRGGIPQDSIALLEATVKGFEAEMKSNNDLLKKYNDGYNGVSALKEYYEKDRDQISKDKQRFTQLKIAYNTPISAVHIVETGPVPIVKSRPMRSLIVASVALVALIFSIAVVLMIDNYKNVDWNAVMQSSNGKATNPKSEKLSV